jgi:hypothetical protein
VFKTDTKKLIKVEKDNEILKNLFVTRDEDEVLEEFEKEKDAEIEKELGS